jgi:hypothetical protein
MTDERYWEIADEFEITGRDGQSVVPADRVDELIVRIWEHNRNCASHTRREESEADLSLFSFEGISEEEVMDKAKKVYDSFETVKGRSRKNPPYRYITEAKYKTLGDTITIRKALDVWWNSVRVHYDKGETHGIACIYKCCDGSYELTDLKDAFGWSDKQVLDRLIEMEFRYDDDLDGYPIVFATLLQ